MALREYFNQHPLVLLQIAGWTGYILIDILGHISSGYHLYGQSLSYGIAAFALTSTVALLTSRNQNTNLLVQSSFFLALLYLAAILWHKIYKIVHLQPNESYWNKLTSIFQQPPLEWFQIGTMPVFLFFGWGGFYLAAKWYFAHQKQQQELAHALIDKKQAQLETLRSQLNPHFLFNVLNSIDVSVLKGDKQTAHQMLNQLSSFLRHTLQEGENDKITLKTELKVIQDFIAIEQLRFGDSLAIHSHIEQNCLNALIPPMLLQPPIENAIKYGWNQQKPTQVDILISKQEQVLKILIKNTKDKVNQSVGTGTGLKNTKARLDLLYGEDATVFIHDTQDQFEIELLLPFELHI